MTHASYGKCATCGTEGLLAWLTRAADGQLCCPRCHWVAGGRHEPSFHDVPDPVAPSGGPKSWAESERIGTNGAEILDTIARDRYVVEPVGPTQEAVKIDRIFRDRIDPANVYRVDYQTEPEGDRVRGRRNITVEYVSVSRQSITVEQGWALKIISDALLVFFPRDRAINITSVQHLSLALYDIGRLFKRRTASTTGKGEDYNTLFRAVPVRWLYAQGIILDIWTAASGRPFVLPPLGSFHADLRERSVVPPAPTPGALAPPESERAERGPSLTNPWPEQVPGLGPRSVGPYESCVDCVAGPRVVHTLTLAEGMEPLEYDAPKGTWARYGQTPLCHRHAVARWNESPPHPIRSWPSSSL